MSDNLPPLPAWLDEFPHEHREWIIPRLQAYAREAASNEADDFQPVVEEVERLQKALAFWMPGVPGANHALHDRVAHDAYLLAGYDGPNNEPSAFELGHVSLSGIEDDLVSRDVPAGWKLVPVEPTTAMVNAGADCDPERESVWDAMLAASPQPQPVQAQPSDVQWQKRHPNRDAGEWVNTNEHDAKWWKANGNAGWEIRVLYAKPVEHEGMTIAGNGAEELGALMREQWSSPNRGGVYPDGNPNAASKREKP